MRTINFKALSFVIDDDNNIYLDSFYGQGKEEDSNFLKFHTLADVSILGNNKDSHLGNKMVYSSEGRSLKYLGHVQDDKSLLISLKNDQIIVNMHFDAYDDTNAMRVFSEVKNISKEDIIIEELSIFKIVNFGTIDDANSLYFTRFIQSHHMECQPRTYSFYDLGMHRGNWESQRMISHTNIGSWSTKEELPQGIINVDNNHFIMFQIESNSMWHYEIADVGGRYYLYLGGNNLVNNGWRINLPANESYRTEYASISYGNSLNDVIANMTKYRRHIYYKSEADMNLPTIFNEYMHLSWDSPDENKTKEYAKFVADSGVKYYVIDCGWHDEVDASIIYKYVGCWKESKARFPHGIKATTDYLHSLGLKAGLWIEPEIVGMNNQEMLDYYGDECFIQRNGKKVLVMNRYFLDYRHPKVIDYMSKTIDRMVNEYGADYIKMDYNQEQGAGTDVKVFSFGEGLMETTKAFFNWVKTMEKKYPHVIFEGCSSGGMRMDYKTLSCFPLVSTSDQTSTYKYPYIACNILSAVLPEQAAVWAYPVSNVEDYELAKDPTWVKENISDDYVAMNMINSFLGRIHLASNLPLLNDSGKSLVKEGISFYNTLIDIKKNAVPYFPLGFTKYNDQTCASGLKSDKELCLSIYNLNGNKDLDIDIEDFQNIDRVYPSKSLNKVTIKNKKLHVSFTSDYESVFVVLKK